MAGDEIDAGIRASAAMLVEIAAAAQPVSELRGGAAVSFPESPDGVPIFAVPLRPQDRKVSHLIAAFAQVPRLGNELDLRQNGILVDDIEECSQLVDFVQLAGQGAGEIKAETVHVHLQYPVAQAIHDELKHARIA